MSSEKQPFAENVKGHQGSLIKAAGTNRVELLIGVPRTLKRTLCNEDEDEECNFIHPSNINIYIVAY